MYIYVDIILLTSLVNAHKNAFGGTNKTRYFARVNSMYLDPHQNPFHLH